MTDRDDIEHLLHRYAELFDAGEWEEFARLFQFGTMTSTFDGVTRDSVEFLKQHETYSIRYADGTPQTAHLITNVQVWVDDDHNAHSRCYVTVLQATDQLPLQPIYVGQYFDTFQKIDGEWFFKDRKSKARLRGDQSRHQLPKRVGPTRE